MNAVYASEQRELEVVDEAEPFFAPVPSDVIDGLIGQYQLARKRIDQVVEIVGGELGNVMHYFIEGNAGDDRLHRSIYVDKLFQAEGGIAQLDSSFWSKALALTDVYQCMPQNRKNEWHEQLRNPLGKPKRHSHYDEEEAKREGRILPRWEVEPLPHFEEETVRSTITSLLHARQQFLGEKVDGIFRALSGRHVTNAPEAFGKRMIVAGVISSYGTIEHTRAGYLHDLRCVIAKFMGRPEPTHMGTTDAIIQTSRSRSGKWVIADGGALRIRTYQVGTAHLEVHPDMAYRLNQILAFLHPAAIPAEFRQKPPRRSKDWPVLTQPLPFPVLEMLCERQYPNRDYPVPGVKVFRFGFDAKQKNAAAFAQACRVLESIGGVRGRLEHNFEFDFDYWPALEEIRTTGCVPNQVAHQFYPTPENLAQRAVALAEVGEAHSCLEPSAGLGALASGLPPEHPLRRAVTAALHGAACSGLHDP